MFVDFVVIVFECEGVICVMLYCVIEWFLWVFLVYCIYGIGGVVLVSDVVIWMIVWEWVEVYFVFGEGLIIDLILMWLVGEGLGGLVLVVDVVWCF